MISFLKFNIFNVLDEKAYFLGNGGNTYKSHRFRSQIRTFE